MSRLSGDLTTIPVLLDVLIVLPEEVVRVKEGREGGSEGGDGGTKQKYLAYPSMFCHS